MLDFNGKELKIGDTVAMIIPSFKELEKGIIVKITSENRATVQYLYRGDKLKITSRESRQLLKI